jgi:hypothetical protein
MTTSPHDDPHETGPSTAPGAIGKARTDSAFSIFHEPWWLDIATDGQWGEARVEQDGSVLGRLPYPCARFYGLRIATMPRLIPALGPAIAALPGKAATTLRRRLDIINALIDQLPEFAYFEQVFDPRVNDAAGFVFRGFIAGTCDCFRIPQGYGPQDVWSRMETGRQQEILDAAGEFRSGPVDDVEELFRLDRAVVRGGNAAERLRSLSRVIGERGVGVILGARDRVGTLRAAIVLVWDSVAAYRLIGVRGANVPDAAESMLLWEAMQIVLPQGRAFDLGAVGSPASLRFLAGFGDYLTPRVGVHRASRQYRLRKVAASIFGTPTV